MATASARSRHDDQVPDERDRTKAPAAAWRVPVLFLTATYMLNFLDRQVVNIIAEPLKQEMQLADWQIGLLTGAAFAVFYSLFGLPIARLAERHNRVRIIAAAVLCWSGFTALCGTATSFGQLLLYRAGVAIGEAGGTPPAHSLISDLAPAEKRASALALYHMGLPLGALLGLVVGGVAADALGWRSAFLWAGLPGIAVAGLTILVLRDPRASAPLSPPKAAAREGVWTTLRTLAGRRPFVQVTLAAVVCSFVAYAHQAFTAAYLLRVHGAEAGAAARALGLGALGFVGISLGLITGLAGGFGTLAGGWIADRWRRTGVGVYCLVAAIAVAGAIPFQVCAFLAPSLGLALWSLVPGIMLSSAWLGPVQATVQTIAPPRMRATASAIVLLAINLFGLGLGPLLLGVASDALTLSGMGEGEAVRWALAGSTLIYGAALIAFLQAWRSLRQAAEELG